MARRFTSNFATNDLTATEWTATAGTAPTIVTSPVRSGTYALRCASDTDGTSNVYRAFSPTVAVGNWIYARFYFRFAAKGSGTRFDIVLARLGRAISDGLGMEVKFGKNAGETNLFLKNSITSGYSATNTDALTADTWYRLELKYLNQDADGEMHLSVYNEDGTQLGSAISITGVDTSYGAFGTLLLGNIASPRTFEFYYQSVAVNDASGTFQTTGYPIGAAKSAIMTPAAEVACAWTPSTGTDNAANVDDVPGTPDDATTYNSDTATTNVDRLTLTDLPAEVPSNATITLVDVYARVGSDATTGSPSIVLRLWDEDATPTDGPALSCDIAGWRICATNEHLVYDASGKTKADLGNFDVGYKGNAEAAEDKYVTALWANVEWLESGEAPAAPTLHLVTAARWR